MSNVRNIWLFGNKNNRILSNKDALITSYVQYMLTKTMSMFEYHDLPDSIPQREIEMILQLCRFAIFTKRDDKLYVFYGGLGGQPNEYYQPSQAIVSNPYLRFSKVLNLDDYTKDGKTQLDGDVVDAVVVWNDNAHVGLYPMFMKNAELLAECDITLKYLLVNRRFQNVLTADNDNTKESIETMFHNIEDGNGYAVIVTTNLMEESNVGKIDTGVTQSVSQLKDVIETQQYIKGSWFNDLGLNANFNMKRESINESESDMNEDALLPMIDDMLKCRKQGVEKINALFGTNISVELSSSWKKLREEIVQREELQDAEIEQIAQSDEESATEEESVEKVEEDVVQE